MARRDWRELNRAWWNERAPLHVDGDYPVEAFLDGESTLRLFELEDLGDVTGLDLVHLQCHIGLDTLSWARLGARVTGLDFSVPAIEAAERLAAQADLPARFVAADVYDAPRALGRRFDLVYTGLGALNWLPDIERWADTVASLVDPGGRVYVAEFHPFAYLLDDELRVERPYFHTQPHVFAESGSYAALDAVTTHNLTHEWCHPISAVIDSLVRRGLALERFREHDYTLFPQWPLLEQAPNRTWRVPDDTPSLPLMYSILLSRPLSPRDQDGSA